jgi:formylglycine-generating enzyme required for sulfatase activity
LTYNRAAVFFVLLCAAAIACAQTVVVSGGSFTMGSPGGERDEQPPHEATVGDFRMMAHEVTEAQYDSCVAAGNCTPAHYEDGVCRAWNGRKFLSVRVRSTARAPDNPVVCVTWYQAQQYCRACGMGLPTEMQWEYAARAGTSHDEGSGDPPRGAAVSRSDGPQRVGIGPPNRWGLYDMIGNVWEWVRDTYAADAYQSDSSVPAAGFYRVIRGGGWYSTASQATVANRERFSPDFGEVSIGFRCVAGYK